MPPAPAPDDEPELDDPELRRAKTVLFLLTVGVLASVTAVLVALFRPRDQVRVTRYPNGYPRESTHYVLDAAGQPLEQGEHRAWHADGSLAEEGRYETGHRSGPWRFWRPDGSLDRERSGVYDAGRRVGALAER